MKVPKRQCVQNKDIVLPFATGSYLPEIDLRKGRTLIHSLNIIFDLQSLFIKSMGYGLGTLFLIFFILPLTLILVLFWRKTRKKVFLIILMMIWIPMSCIIVLITTILTYNYINSKKELSKDDIYGNYVIYRSKYAGKQADWQFNHYRFEITDDNKFKFFETENDRIIKIDSGTTSFLEKYNEPRIELSVGYPRNHIIEDKPTLYREKFSFYYVFRSPKFGNVFFHKGNWKPIDK